MQTFTLTDRTRVAVVLPEAEAVLKAGTGVTIRGCGDAATKVVNLAEVLKRHSPALHQITRVREDSSGNWLEVDLSPSPLDPSDPGYQYCGSQLQD